MAAHKEEGQETPKLYCAHCHRKIHDVHKMAAPTTGGIFI